MRASEFISEDINPDVYHQDFSHELEIDGIVYRAKTLKNDQQFVVRAYAGKQCIGFAKFRLPRHEGLSLSSDWTKVAKSYRNKGIASNMYAYARMLGNTINPSSYQLDPGRRMWDKWREKGDAKHLSETDDDMFAPTKGMRIADALIRIAISELRELRHNLEVATDPVEKEWTRDQITDMPQLIELANTFRTEPLSVALDAAESLSFVLSIDFIDLLLHHDNINLRELFTGWEPEDN